MATYGAKVSRQGFDVDTASDKQLAFSSEFPLLPIEAEGQFSVTADTSYDQAIYTHNLGYAPVFFFWYETGGKLYPDGVRFPYNVYVTSTTIHLEDYIFEDGTIHWKVFRRALGTTYEATIINSTDATEKDSGDYGITISLPGKDISSTDKRNFGVRSDVRQLMIHKTGLTGSVTTATINHGLNYKPMYWLYLETGYRNPAGSFSLIAETDDFLVEVTTTQLSWTFYAGDSFRYAYLIFKDPINARG